MKIFFANYRSAVLLTNKRGTPRIVSSIIIGFFVGVGGSYLLGYHFISLSIIVLGIGGILVGVAVTALVTGNKIDHTRSGSAKRHVPRIISEWHYRPREAGRRYATTNSGSAETSEVLRPENFAINSDAWFNIDSREYPAHTFINLDPTVEEVTTKAPLSGHESAVSMYD
jgi:hypothetical protein